MTSTKFHRMALLLAGGASLIGVSASAQASHVLFSTDKSLAGRDLASGQDVSVDHGTTQIELENGAIASFVDTAQFSLRADGGIDLRRGTVTVVTPSGAPVNIYMPEGVKGAVEGANGSGSFTANATGSRGSAISGDVKVGIGVTAKQFAPGTFWSSAGGKSPALVVANTPVAAPEAGGVRSTRAGGVAASAENGLPVTLGEALAAIGAQGDIVAAARRVEAYSQNPRLSSFPRADYTTLTAYAAQAASPYGGAAFNGAGADIVRTYFQYLATGGAAGSFQSGYAALLVNYLDLVRTGALPSSFTGATQSQLSAYIAFIGRTQGFGSLSVNNQNLLNAYLDFLQTGGSPDRFALNASTLVGAYLDYVRGGGDPAKFTQASASIISQYLAILQSGGIKGQLTAPNQALLAAYIANGNSIVFASTEATQLAAFTAYLNKGGLPSQYTAVDVATLRLYLQTLSDTGLFDRLLGSQSAFLRSYLVYLQGGGTVDSFSQLPINVLTQQAGALNSYYTYIQNGGTPSLYTNLTQAQILGYLTALQNAGLFNRLLGSTSSGFLADYFVYLNTGGNPDIYAGLPNVDLNAYASQVQAFVAFLKAGNLPANYTTLTADQIRAYINALSASGKLAALTGANASFLSAYLAYLQGGGAPNAYSGLPIVTYQNYATALNAYYVYLNGGGLPSGYTTLTAAQIQAYLAALQTNGQLVALLGANATFFTNYLSYISGGGAIDSFGSLPIITYQNYATALNAYYVYLNGGGLPSGYTALTAAQIQAYLSALQSNGQFLALLGANAPFFTSYLSYIAGGGTPNSYTGLPIITYQNYATALNAYYVYLNGGGTPTGYTVLTQAQILAYLQALSGAGQITALLGSNATFFSGYFTYLAGGGAPNGYGGLPVMGGGTGSILSNANVYVPVATAASYAVTFTGSLNGDTGTNGNPEDGSATFSGGVPTALVINQGRYANNVTLTRGTAKTIEAGGDQFASIGRWTDGTITNSYSGNKTLTANQGVHYLVEVPTATLPTSGTVDYSIFAKTSPTWVNSTFGAGTFDAKMRVIFSNATPRAYILGTLVMPEAAGLNTYNVGKQSEYDTPSLYGSFSTATGINIGELIYGVGTACASGDYCQIIFRGGAAGPNAARMGFTYQTHGFSQPADIVQGAVIFGANGTFTPGSVTPTPTPPASPTYFATNFITLTNAALDIQGTGELNSYGTTPQVVGQGPLTRGSNTSNDTGSLAGAIGWSRWAGGTTGGSDLISGSTAGRTYPANGGQGLIWGVAPTAVQASGSATYTKSGGTTPIVANSSGSAPGILKSASLAVNFSTQRVGFESIVFAGSRDIAIATPGGVANPSGTLRTDYTFSGTLQNSTDAGEMRGFLAGTGAGYAGVHYLFVPVGGTSTISGVIAFTKGP
jgi:hypothetical protein